MPLASRSSQLCAAGLDAALTARCRLCINRWMLVLKRRRRCASRCRVYRREWLYQSYDIIGDFQVIRHFIYGWTILLCAVVVNVVAKKVNMLTWYSWLQGEPLTIPGAVFIFVLYPGMFGALVYVFKRVEASSRLRSSAVSLAHGSHDLKQQVDDV